MAGCLGLAIGASRSGLLAQAVPATVVTDKAGYLAGETVAITGDGFAPNEVVTLRVTHADGNAEAGAGHEAFSVTADEAGALTATWAVGEDAAGYRFLLTATRATDPLLGEVAPVGFRRIALVQTDRFDYQPGETAVISGAGFNKDEEVTVHVGHANGLDDGGGHQPFTVLADADGRIGPLPWLVEHGDSQGAIFRLTATGRASGLVATHAFTDALITIVDDAGPDDEPGQKDLSFLKVDYTPATPDLAVMWGWDDTRWTGNNTGDACTLFDTDADGMANYSLCITVDQAGQYLATRLYNCTADSRTDRCGGPAQDTTFISTGSAAVQAVDPFGTTGRTNNDCNSSVAGACLTDDTVAALTVKLADFPGATAARLINVCSYPSQEPNSDPSDCVVTPNSGFLTIVKSATPNEGTTFTFTSSGASQSGATSWSINGSGSVQLISFAAGTYDLAEAIPAGWMLSSASCAIQTNPPTTTGTAAAPPAVVGPASAGVTSLEIRPGLETICTFADDKQLGSIRIVKESVGGDGTFSFTPTGFGSGAFELTTVDGTSSQVFGSLMPGSSYAISETVPSGWDLTSASCSNGTPTAITVVGGETTTCTFTNTSFRVSRGRIIVDKVTNPAADPTSFSFALSDSSVTIAPFNLTDTATPYTSDDLVPGTYAVSETVPPGWTLSATCDGAPYASGSPLALAAGQDIHCIFTNTKDATLTLVKQVVNDNGGTATVADFTLKANATVFVSGQGQVVAPATYALSETGVTGYTAGDWVCSGFSNGGSQSGSSVTVNAGEAVSCSITNDDQPPSLTLVKQVVNDNGGTAVATDFTLTATGPTSLSGPGGATSDASFAKGTYALGETNVAGYTASAWVCVGGTQVGANITLDLGQSATCTITNDDQPAHLVINKVVINDNGGSLDASAFSGTFTGVTSAAGQTWSGATTDRLLTSVGAYSVLEPDTPGYTKSFSAECTGTIALGEVKTCTVTNDDQQAYLTLTKTVVNDNGGSASADDFARFIDGAPVAWNVAVPVTPGAHMASEATLPGYTASAWAGDCAANGAVTVALGEQKTCLITNDDQQAYLTLTKTVVNDHGGNATADDFARFIDGSPVSWNVAVPVTPGAHMASEATLPGYAASAWAGDCAADGAVTIALGERKTCAITNDDVAPTLTLVKTVINDNGGTKVADDFARFIDGTPVAWGTPVTLSAGPHMASETPLSGYAASAWGGDCAANGAVTLQLGDNRTCTITNDDIAPTLTLVKTVINDNGGTKVADDFARFIDGTPVAWGTPVTLSAGPHTASETPLSGYAASAWGGDCAANGAITLQLGDNRTCTITNDDVAPRLTLVKTVINDNGGNKVVSDFPLFINGVPATSGTAYDQLAGALLTATETNRTGYAASAWGGDCAANGTITLLPGDDKTCTITNDDIAPTLTLVKTVVNDNGGTRMADDFARFIDGTPVAWGTPVTLTAGAHTASETTLAGYAASAWGGDCAADGTITLLPGDTSTCTITNNDIQPTLTLVKSVVNDNGGTKTVADFPLFISGSPVTSGVPVGFNAGAYLASETSQYGYTASAWGGDCAANGAVSLSVGQNKICTITNDDQPGTIIIIKNAKPANGSFAFSVTGDGYSGFTLQGDTTGGGNRNSQTLNVGTYTVTESTQLGWILTGIGGSADPSTPYACVVTGSGGSSGLGNLATQTASITLRNGDTVTCTFENTGQGVTRTQGFWATHPQLANIAWTGGSAFGNTFPGVPSIPGIGDNLICGRPLDTTMLPLQNEVMGSFWGDISKTSTGSKRSALDQARMQLLQQLIAAELNAGAFGSVPSGGVGMFAAWESALCGNNTNAIKNAQQQAASFNTNGDSGTFTPGTSADSRSAREVANVPFWNVIKP